MKKESTKKQAKKSNRHEGMRRNFLKNYGGKTKLKDIKGG